MHRQSLLVPALRAPEIAARHGLVADAGEGGADALLVADLAESSESRLIARLSALVIPGSGLDVGEVERCDRDAVGIADPAEQHQGFLPAVLRACPVALRLEDPAQPVEHVRHPLLVAELPV